MHSDIVTFQHNNQPVTTTQEIARITGIRHANILQALYSQKHYYEELGQADMFSRDFIRADTKVLKLNFQFNSNPPKRGRPPVVYLLTQEGALSFVGALTGKKACEFRIAVAKSFVRMEQTIRNIIPALQAEITQLKVENERLKIEPQKQLAGPRKGQLAVPVIQHNLWNEKEIVAWEMQPMDQVDELLITIAKLRHCNTIAHGLEHRKKELTNKLVEDELNRRIQIKDMTIKHFPLPEKKKVKGTTK